MRRNIRKNQLVRRAVTPLFVGCIALGVPAVAVLGSSSSAGAATAQAPASADPIGDLVANLEATVEYDVCVIELSTLNQIERTPGFCIAPPAN
jgi:hypothetical protein